MKQKFSTALSYILIFIIAAAVGNYFRLYPLRTHTSSSASEKATLLVLSKLRQHIKKEVAARSPNLAKAEKELIIKKLLDDLLKKEGANTQNAIARLSKNIDALDAADGISQPYLLASDSFYYYGLTENIAEKGTMAETVKGSKYFNEKMLAPKGHWEPLNLHPYVGYSVYRLAQKWNPDIRMMTAVSYTPLIVASASLIPFIIICYLMGCHPLVTLVGSIFFQCAPIFVKRSTFGWYDNDPYNVFFPLAIFATLFYLLSWIKRKRHTFVSQTVRENEEKITFKSRATWPITLGLAVLSLFWISLYAYFWQGWMMAFSVVILTGVTILLYHGLFLSHQNPMRKTEWISLFQYFSFILIGGFFCITILFGKKEFFTLFNEGWRALTNFLQPQLSLWPDLFISVGELHKSSLSFLLLLTGGWIYSAIAVFGIVAQSVILIIKHRKNEMARTHAINAYQMTALSVFLLSALVISLGAQRFAMLYLIPLSLGFPLGIQTVLRFAENNIHKLQNKKARLLLSGLTLILIASSMAFPIKRIALAMPRLLNPIYNDTWDAAMTAIKNKTEPDAIINAWWPPGHFIKAMAQRRVTIDGATINFPQAYWLSRFYLSTTEKEGLGILRMLNNSANEATEYLQSLGFNLSRAIALVRSIVQQDPFRARLVLSGNQLKDDQINHVLALTHSQPPPSYILIYKEFVENNLQLKFIGNWNFPAIEKINADKLLMSKVPPRNSQAYIDFLWKLAGGQSRYSGQLNQLKRNDHIIVFDQNVTIDMDSKACRIASQKFGTGIPLSIFYLDHDEIIEKRFKEATLGFSVVLFQRNGIYGCALMDRDLAQSLLMRLYFFEGKGMQYITPLIEQSDLTRRTEIMVFQVNWENFEKSQ